MINDDKKIENDKLNIEINTRYEYFNILYPLKQNIYF